MSSLKTKRVFVFGEAEKGEFCTPLQFHSLATLAETLGHPPVESRGIDYAVQTLLSQRELIFFRVREEGFSKEQYLEGVKLLYNRGAKWHLSAIGIPGVGDRDIIDSLAPTCKKLGSILLLSERDLYDYLTGSKY